MSRPNYIKFVEHLYRFNLEFTDEQILAFLDHAYSNNVTRRTLSVFKARLRKKGLKIPDRRKTKKGEPNVR